MVKYGHMWRNNQKNTNSTANKRLSVSSIRRFILSPVLIMVFALSLIALSLFTQTHNSFAAPAASGKNPVVGGNSLVPTDAARSWLYYNMLSYCVKNNNLYREANFSVLGNSRIKVEDAQAGLWFDNATGSTTSASGQWFLATAEPGAESDCSGDNSGWILDAITFWGYKDGIDALCAFGAVRVDGSNCVSGGGGDSDFTGNIENGRRISLGTFQEAVKNKIYGGQSPSLSKAQEYIFYRDSFFASCMEGKTEPETSNIANDKTYMVTMISDQGVKSELFTKYLSDTYGQDAPFFLYNYSGGDGVSKTCAQMVTIINADAAAYQTKAANIPGGDVPTFTKPTPGGSGGTNDITCGSEVAHLGWIVCPVIDALTNLDDYIWTLVSSLLNVNPLKQSDSIYTAWASIRSIANVLFVVFFLIIIFSQLTGAGITNYGVKKLLPKIIIAAILVNISFVIVQLAVDLANIIGSSLYGFITGLAPPIVLGWGDLLRMVLGAAGTGAVGLAGIGLAAAAGFGGVGVIFWVIVPFVLMALLGLLTALLTLIFRQAAIPVLVILAPLAFVAYLLPNTESLYKKWQKYLLSMLMMYPMAAVIFAGAQFAAATIIGNGGNFWNLLIGQVMLALPLFSLPFIAKQGGPILSGLNGALTKMSERARKPLTNWGNTRRDQAAADWMANGPRTRLGQRLDNSRIGGVIGRPRQIARNAAQRRKVREDRMEADKLNFQTEMDRSRTENMGRNVSKNPTPAAREAFEGTGPQAARPPRMLGGGALQSKDELAFAKKDADLAGVAATHRQDDTPWGRQLNKQIATGGLVHKTDEEGTAHRVAQSVEGQAAHQGLGLAQKQTKDDTIVIAHRLNTSAEGQALDQQIGVHEKQATLDTKATTRRLETSHAGIELSQQIGKAEYEEQIDKSNTQGRIDSDPELLEVRQEAAASAEFGKGAKAQDQQLTAEASTEEGRAASIATLVAGGATALDAEGIVDELTTAQRSTDVASQGTAAAERVQKTELRRAALEDGPRGAGTPSDTAVAMGGIDPHGTDRSIAGSIQEGDVEDAKHIDAASIRLTHADLERADVRELARGRPTAGPTGLTGVDVETRIAAQKRIVATGDEEEIARQWDDMRDLRDSAGNPLPAEEADRIRTSFAESLMASKDKSAYYTPAQIELMRTGKLDNHGNPYADTATVIGQAVDAGRYSGAESMATSTNDELEQLLRAAGIDPVTGLPSGIAPTLTGPQIAAIRATAISALGTPRIDERIKRTRQSVERLSAL